MNTVQYSIPSDEISTVSLISPCLPCFPCFPRWLPSLRRSLVSFRHSHHPNNCFADRRIVVNPSETLPKTFVLRSLFCSHSFLIGMTKRQTTAGSAITATAEAVAVVSRPLAEAAGMQNIAISSYVDWRNKLTMVRSCCRCCGRSNNASNRDGKLRCCRFVRAIKTVDRPRPTESPFAATSTRSVHKRWATTIYWHCHSTDQSDRDSESARL